MVLSGARMIEIESLGLAKSERIDPLKKYYIKTAFGEKLAKLLLGLFTRLALKNSIMHCVFCSSFFYLFVELYLCCTNVDLLKKQQQKGFLSYYSEIFSAIQRRLWVTFLGKKVRIGNG